MGKHQALDASTVAHYRSLLSVMLDMMSNGLCFSLTRPLLASVMSQTRSVGAEPPLSSRPKSTLDQMLLLSPTGINHFSSQLLELYQQQQQASKHPQQSGDACCRSAAARDGSSTSSSSTGAVGGSSAGHSGSTAGHSGSTAGHSSSSAGHSGSSAGAGSTAGSSSGSGISSRDCDAFELAEALLLQRADLLQSEAESAAQLATMLHHAGKVFRQHWQQLGYPECLHPVGFQEPPTILASDRDCSSSGGPSSAAHGSNGSCAGGSSNSTSNPEGYISSHPSPSLMGLLDALQLLLDVLLQQPAPPALQVHARATTHVLLVAAAAALSLYGSAAAHVVDGCMTAALALLWHLPHSTLTDTQYDNLWCLVGEIEPQLTSLQRQKRPQQTGSAQQAHTDTVRASRQSMGLLLQIMQQLRLVIDHDGRHTVPCSSGTSGEGASSSHVAGCSSNNCSGAGGSSSSWAGDNSSSSSSSSRSAHSSSGGGRQPGSDGHTISSSCARDSMLWCMMKALPLVANHLQVVLSSEQLANTLQVSQHCEQLAAVFQVVDASLRALWPLLLERDAGPKQPALLGDSSRSATAAVMAAFSMLVVESKTLILPQQREPTVGQQEQQQQPLRRQQQQQEEDVSG
jgi:hypothetical protein